MINYAVSSGKLIILLIHSMLLCKNTYLACVRKRTDALSKKKVEEEERIEECWTEIMYVNKLNYLYPKLQASASYPQQ